MSYRGDLPAISFAGIHTACISGDNGAGKSSLIDAITWALWGKTRATSDDDLISTGTTNTEVEFDFNASDNLYRIIRKRSKGKKPGSAGMSGLDLLIFSDAGFKPITGDTISKTQDSIKTLLRMDYDTFINSAYLRQGHADEFTRQTPANRKEVLANILKLETYEELADLARQKARGKQGEKEITERSIAEMKTELETHEEVSSNLQKAMITLEEENKKHQQIKTTLDNLGQQARSLQDRQEQLNRLKADSNEREKQLSGWERSVRTSRELITAYDELLQQSDAIEEGFSRYTAAKKGFEQMGLQLDQLRRLTEKKNALERSIAQERAKLNSQIEVTKRNVAELEKESSQYPQLHSELEKADADQNILKKQQEELRTVENYVKSLEEELKEIKIQSKQASEKTSDVDERIKLVSDNTEPHCPLCEKPLDDEERNLIIKKYLGEKTDLAAAIRDFSARQSETIRKLNSEMATLKARQTDLQNRVLQNQKNISVLQHKISGSSQAKEKLEIEQKVLVNLLASHDSDQFSTLEQDELIKVTKEIALIDYNEDAYKNIHKTFMETELFGEKHLKLTEAKKQIILERESLALAEDETSTLHERIKLDMAKINLMQEELKELPQILDQLQKTGVLDKKYEESVHNSREQVYKLKARLDTLSELKTKLEGHESKLKTITDEENILKNLVQAFGKNGIQGMLIEIAIPEIENEANHILGRMTDNRMTLKLELQKPKKTGGVIQTLDINIADEEGTRDYEMYSGGEAFRIDFALRIALAKLLANRSGSPLPTLIIDEGFGTQDTVGLEKVTEAINVIQDDFEIILVITHIEELKNAFNNRIEVTKTPEGSRVSIF